MRCGHAYFVVIHDEMVRKSRASRIQSGETSDFTKQTTSKDKQIVDMAMRRRLTIGMDHVGFADGGRLRAPMGRWRRQSHRPQPKVLWRSSSRLAKTLQKRCQHQENGGKQAGDAHDDWTSTMKSRKTKNWIAETKSHKGECWSE